MTKAQQPDIREDDIVVECELEAAPEKVWRALTVPELVATWLEVPTADQPGRDEAGPAYRIIEALPHSRVRYAWSDASASEPDSFVTFDLSPQPGGGTWFRMTHNIEARRMPATAANSNSPLMALAA